MQSVIFSQLTPSKYGPFPQVSMMSSVLLSVFCSRLSRVKTPHCLSEAAAQAPHQHHFSAPRAEKWKNVSLIKS